VWAIVMLSSVADARSFEQCKSASDTTIPELKECNGAEIERRTATIDQLLRQITAALDREPDRRDLLNTAQQAWRAYVDAECDFLMSAEKGSLTAPLIYQSCRLNQQNRRINDLRKSLRIATFFTRQQTPVGSNRNQGAPRR
jgi:uncharacterized protein YecT (DUF1311 family)